jgi:hypothetical protein
MQNSKSMGGGFKKIVLLFIKEIKTMNTKKEKSSEKDIIILYFHTLIKYCHIKRFQIKVYKVSHINTVHLKLIHYTIKKFHVKK